ncbi:lipopolysaccharide assembly protein LapA domain-containing protein [Marilutibacter alkalisoli]|uniref:DUF1049 domain-containing protein n=1 Tax=Marilutibacter alkalisoli TaxID=2591633 RepID=A0A514BRT3_9GAMM|nr:lipopolysaccharide assembly protein LapA domain-containing protein [Lysobacter alkalisoli]QDH70091.1 DUF1049 domain-containing protein [Lysobacter alkalisoli]
MRLIRLFIAIACLMAGAIVGALNRGPVTVDFAVAQVGTTLGVVLLVSLLAGVLLGGLAITAGIVLPLRKRLARAEKQLATDRHHVEPTLSGGEAGHEDGYTG